MGLAFSLLECGRLSRQQINIILTFSIGQALNGLKGVIVVDEVTRNWQNNINISFRCGHSLKGKMINLWSKANLHISKQ